tara:strand:+ start:260 stop:1909 length:1650 start_codon:yes stop_codon:yes gene_type:complete
MGIDDLEKSRYERYLDNTKAAANWVGKKAGNLYDWHRSWDGKRNQVNSSIPYLYNIADKFGFVGTDAPAFDPEKAGTGTKDGFFNKKIPDMYKSYDTQKDFADYGIEMTPEENPILDHSQRVMRTTEDVSRSGINTLSGWWDEGKDLARLVPLTLQEGAKHVYNYGIDNPIDNAIRKKYPSWNNRAPLRTEGMGEGYRWLKDSAADTLNMVGFNIPSGERNTESMTSFQDYAPPVLKNGYRDTDLNNWDMYQNWKTGSGWSASDDARIDKKVKSEMDKMNFDPAEMMQEWMEMADESWWNTPGKREFYFPQYMDAVKEGIGSNLKNSIEFEETGEKYADWAGDKYRANMLGTHDSYTLPSDLGMDNKEALEFYNANMSPYEGVDANFQMVNDAYLDELKAGKNPSDIGEPNEFNYGYMDSVSGPGLNESTKKMEYSTPEAKEAMESSQMLAIEIAATFGITAPLKIQKIAQELAQGTKVGRVLRELMPGTFQWGNRGKFGLPKFAEKTADGKTNWMYYALNSPAKTIDWARPKGAQMGAVLMASDEDKY